MFGNSPDLWLMKVTVPAAIRFTRADTRWFDAYWKERRDDYIDGYWSGRPYSANEYRWEYLVEGVLKLSRDKQLTKLRQEGAMALGLDLSR